MKVNDDSLKAAQNLWNYLKLDQSLIHCDCMIAMGSHDLRVAEHAAKLTMDGWAPILVCSGGFGRLTENLWKKSEARQFANAAFAAGVPAERILIEDQSSNTGENIHFSKKLLKTKGITAQKVLLVHKPYMERRSLATALKVWTEAEYCIASPPITFENYATDAIPLDQLIHIMVGDFQRILVYPEKGFQVPQEIPEDIMSSFQKLLDTGFTEHVLSASH